MVERLSTQASNNPPSWPASPAEGIALAKAAAGGDPVARDMIMRLVEVHIPYLSKRGLERFGIELTDDVWSELSLRFLEWLEAPHKIQGGQGSRTGWKIVGEFSGRSSLATYLGHQMFNIVLQYATDLGTQPKLLSENYRDDGESVAFPDDGESVASPDTGCLEYSGKDVPVEDQKPLSLAWPVDEITEVKKVDKNPVHRLVYYLYFLAVHLPPPEEVIEAANVLGLEHDELLRRVWDLHEEISTKVQKRDVALHTKLDTLSKKLWRFGVLRKKEALPTALSVDEERERHKLEYEVIPKLRRECGDLENKVIHPSLRRIAEVLVIPGENARNQSVVSDWMNKVRNGLKERVNAGPPQRHRRTAMRGRSQQSARSARPSGRRSP